MKIQKLPKYNTPKAKEYLEQGKLLECIYLRTGRGNLSGAVNGLYQLNVICKENNLDPTNYYKVVDIESIHPKDPIIKFKMYWRKNDVQFLYKRSFLVIPYKNEVGILLKLYKDDFNKVLEATLESMK